MKESERGWTIWEDHSFILMRRSLSEMFFKYKYERDTNDWISLICVHCFYFLNIDSDSVPVWWPLRGPQAQLLHSLTVSGCGCWGATGGEAKNRKWEDRFRLGTGLNDTRIWLSRHPPNTKHCRRGLSALCRACLPGQCNWTFRNAFR